MKKFLLLFPFVLLSGFTQAQSTYSINNIDKELLQNANVVVRLEEKNINIKNEGSVVIKNKYVYTILNAAGDAYARFLESYDQLSKIQHISGDLYNADGVKIKSLKKNDIKDYSNTSESNLADDDRVKFHNFNHRIYPYTVAYESTEELAGLFYLPKWVPVFDEKVAVEKSLLTVETPADYILRNKSFNYVKEPVITNSKNRLVYEWQVENFKAATEESYAAPWHEITPSVFLAPTVFEMQKYRGSMNNWEEFGAFFYKLNLNRDVLPEKIKQTVHSLTDHLTTDKEKIFALYKYLQQNTRYISIQFGIGGWQTLDAGFVAGNGYGDCKALNNYMYALLKEVGIKSYYTLVKAGDYNQYFIKDFTSNQFNHIILCVPQPKDSIWLECTSQTQPAGYLGAFTSNRPVLLIDEKGGILTATPCYTAEDNLQVRSITATLNGAGELDASISSTYRAEQQDDLFGMLHQLSKEKIDEHMKTKFNIASYVINHFEHKETSDPLPVIKENVKLTANNYASISGKRLFINPNILSVSSFRIKNVAERKFDFYFKRPFTDYDTVQINIPPGFKIESKPADVSLSHPLAQFKSTVNILPNKIIYTRYYHQLSGRIAAADIKEIADIFDRIYKSDHATIVFVKEDSK